MRRLAPRPIGAALEKALSGTRPPGLLADVQAVWPGVAGDSLAASASPVSERDGLVTVACESAVWAQELELLGADLIARLNARLTQGAVVRLRFVVGSDPNRR
ncbi:MAG: DciA family protein [Solirubrobacterales bacterium]